MTDIDMTKRAVRSIVETRRQPKEWEFRNFVDYLFQSKREGIEGFHHATTGLAGEAGECLDLTKKLWVYDRPLNEETMDKLLEEAGDTLHYLVMLLIKISEHEGGHYTLGDLMLNNVLKLNKRYPDGFSKAAAIARADKTPNAAGPGSEARGPSLTLGHDDHFNHDHTGC